MDTLFTCTGLTKKLEKHAPKGQAPLSFTLSGVDFSLRGGEVVGLIGKNGSGKTTLIKTILGLYGLWEKEDRGQLALGGLDSIKDRADYLKDLGFVLIDNPFPPSYTPMEIGEIYGPFYRDFCLLAYQKKLEDFQVYSGRAWWQKDKNVSGEMTDLSDGERLKAQLAFALSHETRLMVMDEPTGNLDVEFREEFYRVIRDYVADEDHAVLISSHIIEEVEQIADRLLWLGRRDDKGCREGYVRFFGTQEELKESCRILEGDADLIRRIPSDLLIGREIGTDHAKALVRADGLSPEMADCARYGDLKEIFYFMEKEMV